jgi:hypothetical protein
LHSRTASASNHIISSSIESASTAASSNCLSSSIRSIASEASSLNRIASSLNQEHSISISIESNYSTSCSNIESTAASNPHHHQSKDTQGGRKGKKPEEKGKFKKAPKPSKKKSDKDKWALKNTPQAGEPNTKCMPGFDKDHHWCDDNQSWTVHLPEDCELRQSRQQEDSASTDMPSVLGYDSEQELELWSLTIMVCIQGILQIWLRLIFLPGFVMYENPELVFALLMGPNLYDVYLAMIVLAAITLVVI